LIPFSKLSIEGSINLSLALSLHISVGVWQELAFAASIEPANALTHEPILQGLVQVWPLCLHPLLVILSLCHFVPQAGHVRSSVIISCTNEAAATHQWLAVCYVVFVKHTINLQCFLVPKEYCSLKQVTLDILTYFLYVNLDQMSIRHLCNQHTILFLLLLCSSSGHHGWWFALCCGPFGWLIVIFLLGMLPVIHSNFLRGWKSSFLFKSCNPELGLTNRCTKFVDSNKLPPTVSKSSYLVIESAG
jgi:hypothetical protein